MPKRLSIEPKSPPSLDRVLFLFNYSPETGEVRRAVSRGNGAAGSLVGVKSKRDHTQIMVDGEVYETHQVIWLMMTGAWPSFEIDHKDLDTKNNKWRNLREATHTQNMANRPLYKSSTTGIKGVSLKKGRLGRPYVARITVLKKTINLGSFETAEAAGVAYRTASVIYFGEFARAA